MRNNRVALVQLTRTFRDGSEQVWWAVEIVAGPYGPGKAERAVVATTDPATLPDLTTWYLVTNLPALGDDVEASPFSPADLAEIIRLYGLRTWVEQNYKHVKHALGWSQYQVRNDTAMRRHWQLVCCAFSFCWYYVSQLEACAGKAFPQPPASAALSETGGPATGPGTRKKNQRSNHQAAPGLLAPSPASGSCLAGALDYAATLLESVVRTAPSWSAPGAV